MASTATDLPRIHGPRIADPINLSCERSRLKTIAGAWRACSTPATSFTKTPAVLRACGLVRSAGDLVPPPEWRRRFSRPRRCHSANARQFWQRLRPINFGACETKVPTGAFLIRLRRWETVPPLAPTDSRDGGPMMPLPRPVLRYRLSAPRLAPAPPPPAPLRNGQKHPELRPVLPVRWGASKKAVTPPAFRRQPE